VTRCRQEGDLGHDALLPASPAPGARLLDLGNAVLDDQQQQQQQQQQTGGVSC